MNFSSSGGLGHWEPSARLILSGACSSCQRSACCLSQSLSVFCCQPVASVSDGHAHTRTQMRSHKHTTRVTAWTAAGMFDCRQLETNQTAGDTSAPHKRLFARVICTERKHWRGQKWHLTSQRSRFVFDRGGSTRWVTARLRFACLPRVRRAGLSNDGQKNDRFCSATEI